MILCVGSVVESDQATFGIRLKGFWNRKVCKYLIEQVGKFHIFYSLVYSTENCMVSQNYKFLTESKIAHMQIYPYLKIFFSFVRFITWSLQGKYPGFPSMNQQAWAIDHFVSESGLLGSSLKKKASSKLSDKCYSFPGITVGIDLILCIFDIIDTFLMLSLYLMTTSLLMREKSSAFLTKWKTIQREKYVASKIIY